MPAIDAIFADELPPAIETPAHLQSIDLWSDDESHASVSHKPRRVRP